MSTPIPPESPLLKSRLLNSPLLNSLRGKLQLIQFSGPLLARLTVGVAFIESGYGKVNNLEKVTEFFTELGIPLPAFQALFVSNVELIGGTLILVGFLTRLAAWPLVATMAVALLTAKAEDISSFSDLIGTIEWTYAALLVWLGISGAGAVSLDHVFYKRFSEGKRRGSARSHAQATEPVA